jgi:hypothetical protein
MAREIRFAVARGDDLRSSVWRLWPNKNDLYLASRTLAGLSKISFHASGVCRYAIVSQTPRAPLDQWKRPPRTPEGITPAIDIMVPDFQVAGSFRDQKPPEDKKLELIQGPPEGARLIVRIFLADPDIAESDIRSLYRGSPISVHGNVHLTREAAWLISCPGEKLKRAEVEWLDNLVNTTRINFSPGEPPDPQRPPDGVTAHLHIFEHHAGFPTRLIDVQLGSGNIFVDQAPVE